MGCGSGLSMQGISNEASRFEQSTLRPIFKTVVSVISNPAFLIGTAILGPVMGLVGAALTQDQQQAPVVEQAAQDNTVDMTAVDEAQAANDAALLEAQQAEEAANAAAQQAATDAQAAQDQVQASTTLDTTDTPSVSTPSFMPSGGGGGGGGFGPVPDVSAIEAGGPPPFEQQPIFDQQPMFDLKTQYMQSQALDQEFQEQSAPITTPQEFFPEDETTQLTISDQQSSDQSFEGFGRVINYPEAEDIGFSKIPSAMYTPLIEYDESHAPKYVETGPLLPVHNRMKADLERPSSGSGMPTRGEIIPSYNNPMYAIQDIPDDMPSRLIDYPSRGHQTSMPIRRSELPLSMPIRTNFGSADRPSPFNEMLKDLRSLQDHLQQLIKNAESYSKYNARFSGMVSMPSVMAPIRKNLDELEEATKYIKRSRKNNRPANAEEHEQSRYAKKLIDDLSDDVKTLRNTIEQAGG